MHPRLRNDRATCVLRRLFRLGLRRFCSMLDSWHDLDNGISSVYTFIKSTTLESNMSPSDLIRPDLHLTSASTREPATGLCSLATPLP